MHERRADAICLGSTTMHQAHGFLAENLPVPVVNPGPLTYKLAELVLGLRLTHSRAAYPKPNGEGRDDARDARGRGLRRTGKRPLGRRVLGSSPGVGLDVSLVRVCRGPS